ncbi:MAG: biotin/lipoyl-containing protein [Candidatus Methanosuratincola sp.]
MEAERTALLVGVEMMKFVITVNGTRKEVEVSPEGEDLLSVKVDGKAYSVIVDSSTQGKARSEMTGSAPADAFSIGASGTAGVDPAPPAASAQTPVPTSEQLPVKQKSVRVVKSPLPGVVSSVEVRPGQRVEKGATLMYIESMKMLNDIVSPSNGRVLEIIKASGETVNIGDPLLKLDEDGE